MPLIHFVETKESEKNKCLCFWVEKFYSLGKKVQIAVLEHVEAQNLDYLLWVFSQKSFIPHEIGYPGEYDSLTPVFILTEDIKIPQCEVLVMSRLCPLDFVSRFSESVTFVCLDSEDQRKECRNYWLEAKERGFELKHHRYRPLGALRS